MTNAVLLTRGQCPRCGTDDHTRRIVDTDDKHFGFCRACAAVLRRYKDGKRLQHDDDSRQCYLCKRQQSLSQFNQRSNGSYFSACKDCNRWCLGARSRARKAAK